MLMFIDGKYVAATDGQTMPVIDPTTGKSFDTVPLGGAADADAAIKSSARAFKIWKQTPMTERVRLQNACATAMRTNATSLAQLLSEELGRPMPGCLQEMSRAAELLDIYAEEGLRLQGTFALGAAHGEKTLVTRDPVGVVVAITPFIFPSIYCYSNWVQL